MQRLDDAKKLGNNRALPRGSEIGILQPDEGCDQCVNWRSPASPDRRLSGFQEKTMKEAPTACTTTLGAAHCSHCCQSYQADHLGKARLSTTSGSSNLFSSTRFGRNEFS